MKLLISTDTLGLSAGSAERADFTASGEADIVAAARVHRVVEEAFRAARIPLSLETPIGEEGESTMADLVADTNARAPSEAAEDTALSDQLERALRDILRPREAEVIRLRFGLDRGGEQRTLGEVGQELGISRERVRQIEADVLGKLRRTTALRRQFAEFI